MTFQSLEVESRNGCCTVTIARPEAANAIDARLIEELGQVLTQCEDPTRSPPVTLMVLRGQPEAFCTGADFDTLVASGYATEAGTSSTVDSADPEPLYDLWSRMVAAPFVTVSLVRGRVNAGGVGFVAASDIVLADESASFSLSELLFGLFPACVLPFLIRRIGRQRAHYLTLMTRPIDAREALEWGLVDGLGGDAEELLRRHLLRLRRLSRPGIARYKSYANDLGDSLAAAKPAALQANRRMFEDEENRRNIRRYVEDGKFPWEA